MEHRARSFAVKRYTHALLALASLALSIAVQAETVSFDADESGMLPVGWNSGVTGRGNSRWIVDADATAPSKPHVLKQSGIGSLLWCVRNNVSIADGAVSVRFKPVSGKQDQAGGIVWRWKDGDNYYVARANALENNVALYYTEKGKRITLKYVDAPVAGNIWHELQVIFQGKQIKVILDGRSYIEYEDEHITGPGAVGVWTKADSVTVFDDFTYDARN